MDMSQYLEIFIEESKEHLQGLNQSLLQLEKNPQDVPILNEIFRVAHTLKGMAGTMGFSKMAKLTHDMENVLHALRNNEVKVNTNLVDLLFRCLDALENYVNEVVTKGSEGSEEYSEIIRGLDGILNKKDGKDAAKVDNVLKTGNAEASVEHVTSNFKMNQYEQNLINKAVDINMNVFKITVVLNKGCVLKSARAFIIFQTLERHAEIIKSEPRVEDIEDEKFDFEFTVVVISKRDAETFHKELTSISEVDDVKITTIHSNGTEEIVNEVLSEPQESSAEVHEDATSHHDDSEESEHQKSQASKNNIKTGKTVRVDIDRLDVLMNLVSELIIIKTRLEGLDEIERNQNYNEVIEYFERVTTNLHDAVMKVRMVPIETVFNRFPRMLRDISRSINKEIVLNMSGEDTELDRTVIDEIGDPLIHLLRNSADHGIESLDKRRELGKPDAGQINLRAYQDGNNVVIEVEDDGKGIDLEKVKKKAIDRGFVNKDAAKNLSRKDIIDFLFKPSFSTAEAITDLSGRGVGLDVVKTKIETLGGMVEVDTEAGKGSKFIIRLPLTLAIIQALLVQINTEKYALPLNTIREIIKVKPEDIKQVQKQEIILLRNTIVPIIRIGNCLDVPPSDKQNKLLTVVVVKKGEKLSGFLVDNLIGQHEIVIKSLGKLLAGIKTIAGATILGDGNVALILDVNSLAV
ncbi:chemotaxis protein CheA [Pseudobacteroides cellulosolvens]|uniref:Chemotaxis protein CheA n=1 Tax=Pseudobacteroides cellulosolvens ATCC 35603 = DSM 2933 TaxID=398512 RepID=A0A0L6JRF7_9FIRM|nr:chemotaxis protein CheA [Pseudobacteroides cellulosolvens]KNY28359.1 CheA signal transduction histidine kinase [Pseudobacteroides cellulosolvens ATCC 35603 = DSM 2933]